MQRPLSDPMQQVLSARRDPVDDFAPQIRRRHLWRPKFEPRDLMPCEGGVQPSRCPEDGVALRHPSHSVDTRSLSNGRIPDAATPAR